MRFKPLKSYYQLIQSKQGIETRAANSSLDIKLTVPSASASAYDLYPINLESLIASGDEYLYRISPESIDINGIS